MQIQPLPLIERPTDPRPAPGPTSPHPRPYGWCHTCGSQIQVAPAITAERIAYDVMTGPAFPLQVEAWTPEHLSLLRSIADELKMLADGAETFRAHS